MAVAALSVVVNLTLPEHMMTASRLEIERARMQGEDMRSMALQWKDHAERVSDCLTIQVRGYRQLWIDNRRLQEENRQLHGRLSGSLPSPDTLPEPESRSRARSRTPERGQR